MAPFGDFNFDGKHDSWDDLDAFAFTSGVMDNDGEADDDLLFTIRKRRTVPSEEKRKDEKPLPIYYYSSLSSLLTTHHSTERALGSVAIALVYAIWLKSAPEPEIDELWKGVLQVVLPIVLGIIIYFIVKHIRIKRLAETVFDELLRDIETTCKEYRRVLDIDDAPVFNIESWFSEMRPYVAHLISQGGKRKRKLNLSWLPMDTSDGFDWRELLEPENPYIKKWDNKQIPQFIQDALLLDKKYYAFVMKRWAELNEDIDTVFYKRKSDPEFLVSLGHSYIKWLGEYIQFHYEWKENTYSPVQLCDPVRYYVSKKALEESEESRFYEEEWFREFVTRQM